MSQASNQPPEALATKPPTAKPKPPESQYLILGARLPWVDESKLKGSREPRT